jgi:hypothetical protein
MHYDAMTMQMLKTRADHDAQQRQEQLAEVAVQDKPAADTIMTISEAELLIQAHHYAVGEQIGLAEVGDDRGMGCRTLVHETGEVVMSAAWQPSVKGRQAKLRPNPQKTWTAQRPRKIRGHETA